MQGSIISANTYISLSLKQVIWGHIIIVDPQLLPITHTHNTNFIIMCVFHVWFERDVSSGQTDEQKAS